jgi:hypothetical protein
VSKTEVMNNGVVRVFIDSEHYDIEEQALEMLKSFKIRKAFEALIHTPLTREGIDSFSVLSPENPAEPILHIERSEAIYFIAPAPADEEINDHTTIVSLQIVNASFAEGNKWRFSDGTNTFYADILDEEFVRRVQSSEEVFAKNDILKVRLRISQWLTSRGVRTDYIIQEVIEHRLAHRQIDLFEHQADQ